ncbi:MAG TPA: Mur ligase family protein [Candidatus Limnocylindrales bacterium]
MTGVEGGHLQATFAESVAALETRGRFGIRLGLGRTRALLAALGHPEQGIRGALIGGTNGKGSVVALVGACLAAAGYRAGETPKPHLVSYRERIRIAGHPISQDDFTSLVRAGLPVADRVARRHGPPTEFELLTALAFRHFADERVDLAVVEVGLGGRLDATHAWDGGVAAITNVDLDHTEHLGPTVELIAREKAAIVMRGDLAITGATGPALGPLRRRARRVGVALLEVSPAPVLAFDRRGLVVELPGLGAVRIGLLGRHQATNVAVADAVLDALGVAGIAHVGPDARQAGYAAARWPGRLELLDLPGAGPRGADAEVLLDGAHNPAGARALAAALDELRPELRGFAGSTARWTAASPSSGASASAPAAPSPSARPEAPSPSARHAAPVTLVIGTMADKDVDGLIAALGTSRSLAGARVIATAVPGGRALPPEALAARWLAAFPESDVGFAADPIAALERAVTTAEGPVVVAGSLYLVGAARARLVDDPELRDPGASGPA